MIEEQVGRNETLYRRVSNDPDLFPLKEGVRRISSQAFRDPEMKPSVDRAKLCESDPAYTKLDPADGVLSLLTSEVMGIGDLIQNDAKGRPVQKYDVVAVPDPILEGNPEGLPPNPAHARIYTDPFPPSKRLFNRLQERLALLAEQRGWEIPPHDLR